jgi:hypothetical protein
MTARNVLIAAAALAIMLALACSGSSRQTANLSLSARTTTADSTTTPATTTAPSTSLDLNNGITIDRVRVVVRKLKLDGQGTCNPPAADAGTPDAGTAGTTDAGTTPVAALAALSSSDGGAVDAGGHGDDGETEMERERDCDDEPVMGPFLIDVSGTALSGSVQQFVSTNVPTGSFEELKLVIGPVTADKAGSDAGLGEMAAKNASVIIDGSIDQGAAGKKSFSFVSSLTAEIHIEGQFPVQGDKSNNVTLSLDAKGWFGPGTTPLDPTLPANAAAIEDYIKASVKGFEDDDRSGHENEGGHPADGGADGG